MATVCMGFLYKVPGRLLRESVECRNQLFFLVYVFGAYYVALLIYCLEKNNAVDQQAKVWYILGVPWSTLQRSCDFRKIPFSSLNAEIASWSCP